MSARTYLSVFVCLMAGCAASSPPRESGLPPVAIDFKAGAGAQREGTGCLELEGATTVRAEWRVVDAGTERAHIEGTVDFAKGDSRWRRSLQIAGSDVAAALAGVESTQLTANRSNEGLVRVGILAQHGEDSYFERELVALFDESDGRTLWTGVGTETEVELDACTRTREASFTRLPNGAGVARKIELRAELRSQPLDAELLDRLRRECVVASMQ